jgi:hypothetical protein
MTTPTMSTTPVSGDPEQVRRISAQLATVEARALEVESRLRAIETGVGPQMWRGQAADSFTRLLAETGPDLTRLAISYGAASQALATYATELAAAQDTARAAQAEAITATADRDRATADRDTARSDADRHAAAASDAQQRLDLAAAQDAEQRRADALQRENIARTGIEQAEQALQAARQKAEQAVGQRDSAAARCVRELDDASRVGIDTRNLTQTPAAAEGPPPATPAGAGSLSGLGHLVLDVVGLVPLVGEAADGINAAWYAVEGDYANAALSAAATIPILGSAATGAKLAAKGVSNIIPSSGKTFVAAPGGVIYDVPAQWTSRVADNGKGIVYQQPGAVGNASMIRIMEPTPMYPQGYVRVHNKFGQPVDVYGKPGPQSATHIPRGYTGPWPGWPS